MVCGLVLDDDLTIYLHWMASIQCQHAGIDMDTYMLSYHQEEVPRVYHRVYHLLNFISISQARRGGGHQWS